MKEKIKNVVVSILFELVDIKSIYASLNKKQKAELAELILFGLLINSIYGVFHGNYADAFYVVLIIYAIMKLIKKKGEGNDS